MLSLDNGLRKIELLLAGAENTNKAQWAADYEDFDVSRAGSGGGVGLPAASVGTTNGQTAVTIVPAPGGNATRRLKAFYLNNTDLAAMTVSFRYNDNGTTYVFYKVTLQTLENLYFEDGIGFQHTDVNGALIAQSPATSSAVSTAQLTASAASMSVSQASVSVSQASSAASLGVLGSSQASSLASGIVIASLNSVSSQASSIATAVLPASVNSVSSQASSMASQLPASVSSQASSMASQNPATVSSLQSAASVQSFTSTNWSTISSATSRVKSSFTW